MRISELKINEEYESLVPRVTDEEYALIKESIQKNGIKVPIVINKDNVVIDGHTRIKICKELNITDIEAKIENFKDEFEERLSVIQYNLERRQLNTMQRGLLGLEVKKIEEEKAKVRKEETQPTKGTQIGTKEHKEQIRENIKEVPTLAPHKTDKILELKEVKGKSRDIAADKVGISHGTLDKVEKIVEKAKTNPKIAKELEEAKQGKKSVNKVFQSVKQMEKREEKKGKLIERKMPEDEFEVIYADPPWKYEFSETEKRSLDNQYPQMELDEICKLKFKTTPDAILFLWVTSPKLEEGLKVLNSWGFTYRTNMVWVKDKIGMGYYARQRHELLLIGTKGKIGTPEPENRPNSVIESPRTKHSEKPDLYEIIEKMYPHRKYLELFARTKVEGWESFGNEI